MIQFPITALAQHSHTLQKTDQTPAVHQSGFSIPPSIQDLCQSFNNHSFGILLYSTITALGFCRIQRFLISQNIPHNPLSYWLILRSSPIQQVLPLYSNLRIYLRIYCLYYQDIQTLQTTGIHIVLASNSPELLFFTLAFNVGCIVFVLPYTRSAQRNYFYSIPSSSYAKTETGKSYERSA